MVHLFHVYMVTYLGVNSFTCGSKLGDPKDAVLKIASSD